jgi:hypothetical protein
MPHQDVAENSLVRSVTKILWIFLMGQDILNSNETSFRPGTARLVGIPSVCVIARESLLAEKVHIVVFAILLTRSL